MKAGDAFEVYPPFGANWNIHDNTVTGCLKPVVLDSHGSEASFFRGNVVSRGDATGVRAAIEVRGRFHLIGNHVSDFDEAGSSALALHPDPLGRLPRNVCRGNIFERCANVVSESQKGLWQSCLVEGNMLANCGAAPK
jgi:hypothetical protein